MCFERASALSRSHQRRYPGQNSRKSPVHFGSGSSSPLARQSMVMRAYPGRRSARYMILNAGSAVAGPADAVGNGCAKKLYLMS